MLWISCLLYLWLGGRHIVILGVLPQTVVVVGLQEHEQELCLLLTGARFPWNFHFQALSPFLNMVTIRASLSSEGSSSFSQTLRSRAWMRYRSSNPPSFRISAGIPSGPVALLFLRLLMASWTSIIVGGSPMSSLMGPWGICLVMSISVEMSLLRRSWKYSFHWALMDSLSFSNSWPSFEHRRCRPR